MIPLVFAAIGAASLAVACIMVWLRTRLRIVTVDGDSMRPTLAPGDQLLVRRVPLTRIRTGDIVVLNPPKVKADSATSREFGEMGRRSNWVIKRAVAIPGDPVPASVAHVVDTPSGVPVPAGSLIVIGDNRDVSLDSRVFGYVEADALLGVAVRPFRTRSASQSHGPKNWRKKQWSTS